MSFELPRRIAINALFLEPRMGGLDTYVRALVPQLARLAPEVTFTVFCSPGGREYLEGEGWGEGSPHGSAKGSPHGSAKGSGHGPAHGSAQASGQGSPHGPAQGSGHGPAHGSAQASGQGSPHGWAKGSGHGQAHGSAQASGQGSPHGPAQGSGHGPAHGSGEGRIELVTHPLLGRRGTKALTELSVLGAIAGRRFDLLHSVALTAPLRTRAVNVITLADVTWLVAPDPGEIWTVRLWRAVVPPAARRADRLLALTEAGAEHIVTHLRVPRERIDVVPLAAGRVARAQPTPAAQLRSRLRLGEGPVILSVSAKKVHKNLARLVEAMALVVERQPDAMLVLPGNPTAHEQELRALARDRGIERNVAFPPYVDAPDLEGLYALASCFVVASINEGFGIPILEAMRRGVPVACSNASALPEVAGQAARYFDPLSVPAIGDALTELLCDRELAARLAALGREREAGFTWEATARGTLQSYERAFAGRP